MFTGLIQEVGTLFELRRQGAGGRLRIEAPGMAGDLAVGESVAVDGACLSVESADTRGFAAYASDETLDRTALGGATEGRAVNLERALRLGERLGGHIVSGHVDAVGRIESLEPSGEGWWLTVAAPLEVLSLCVPKGSVAVDGISLTLVDVTDERFTVAVIPQTMADTALGRRGPGAQVNLESDMIGKYVARLMAARMEAPGASDARMMDLLRRGGFAS